MQNVWLDLILAVRNIRRQRRRSAIAVGAVAFGVMALILATGFIERIYVDFREETIRSQLGHLQITKPGYHEAGKADPFAYLLPEVVPAAISNTSPSLLAVAPRLSFGGLISRGSATISFIGDGVSPAEEAKFGDAVRISAGSNLGADDPRSVILGEGLARNLGVSIGDRVVLLATTRSGGTNAVEVTVRGLFSTVSKSYDDAALRLPIATARQLLRVEGAHVWAVLLQDTLQTDAMLALLAGKLPQTEFQVVPWHRLSDFYNKTITLFDKQVQGLRLIVAFIILLCISNTMIMSVLERTGEIGTAMALGTKRAGVLRLFICEGFVLGIIGGSLGLIIGVLLAQAISAVGIPMPPPPGKAHGYLGGIRVTGTMCVQIFALAVFTTLLASVYPAWRAARMQIVDALRHNR